MTLEAAKIESIYSGPVVKNYDRFISHFFKRTRKLAFKNSSLRPGDKVLVFCCGTGLEFPHILEKIGPKGRIVGVDFSMDMLTRARRKIQLNNWNNIELVNADVTAFHGRLDKDFDAAACTLGMSLIPNFKSAFYNMLSNVKKGGEIIVGDMQLATGWRAALNPLTVHISQRYGGTFEGHGNSNALALLMQKELMNTQKQEYFFNSYFLCTGQVPSSF